VRGAGLDRGGEVTTLSVKTKKVVLKDGTVAVINVADFDPAIHSDTAKKPQLVKKKKARKI
jgi:hypothetical protein